VVRNFAKPCVPKGLARVKKRENKMGFAQGEEKMARNYWGYRIDTRKTKYFNDELEQGRLRQGWGYEEQQKLPYTTDKGARGNLPIYENVKKGDILLIPRIPNWNDITIAEATEDFKTWYKFEIDKEHGDYGHIFPVKKIKHFNRHSQNVYAELQRTLKNIRRFWQIPNYGNNIEEIISSKDNEAIPHEKRFSKSLTDAFENSFDNENFKNLIIENAKKNFANETWEYALVEALKIIYPAPHFEVTREGGKKEKEHGTDILIKIFGLSDIEYGIAIQVKDWWGMASRCAIEQLNKADDYWEKEKGIKLIDKMLIMARANYQENENFRQNCIDNKITPIFEEDLSELLYEVGITALLK
jgi:hypothetical protein